jgi:hypothetical protein
VPTNLWPPTEVGLLRKRKSSDAVRGSNKRPYKENDKPELVFNTALDLILRLDQSPLVGSAVYFLTERPWEDCVLLYCVEDELESILHQVPLVFTEEDLATTAYRYRRYTGDQDSNVAKQLTRLIVGLHLLLTTDLLIDDNKESFRSGKQDMYKESFRSEELDKVMDKLSLYDKNHKSKTPLEPIRDDWVDYFAAKVRRGHGPRWQDKPNLWLQIALAYWILVGECSVSEMEESCTVLPRQPIYGLY